MRSQKRLERLRLLAPVAAEKIDELELHTRAHVREVLIKDRNHPITHRLPPAAADHEDLHQHLIALTDLNDTLLLLARVDHAKGMIDADTCLLLGSDVVEPEPVLLGVADRIDGPVLIEDAHDTHKLHQQLIAIPLDDLVLGIGPILSTGPEHVIETLHALAGDEVHIDVHQAALTGSPRKDPERILAELGTIDEGDVAPADERHPRPDGPIEGRVRMIERNEALPGEDRVPATRQRMIEVGNQTLLETLGRDPPAGRGQLVFELERLLERHTRRGVHHIHFSTSQKTKFGTRKRTFLFKIISP